MAETQNPEIQQVSFDDLSKKIQETTDELNKLKNGLNNSSSNQLDITQLRQQSDKLSSIEITILECSYALINLEKDGSLAIEKAQLDELKSQIDTLNSSKEIIKKQIETQTEAALAELNQSVTGKEKGRFGRKREGLGEWRHGLTRGQRNGIRIGGGVLAGAGLFAIFRGRNNNTDDGKTRGELRRERRQQRREERQQRREERRQRREERQKNMEELEKRAEELGKKLEDPPRWAKILGIGEKKS